MHRLGNLRRNSRAGHSFLACLERNPSSEPATRILLRFGLRLVIRLRLYRSPIKILQHNANTIRLRPMPCYSQDRPPVALLGCTPRHLRHMATTPMLRLRRPPTPSAAAAPETAHSRAAPRTRGRCAARERAGTP